MSSGPRLEARVILRIVAMVLLASSTAAQETSTELRKIEAGKPSEQDPEADLSEREEPATYLDALGLPIPCSGPYDWIRFTSGEWLRGRVYRMRRNELEYRSERLKKQVVEWKYVSELCLPDPTRFVLDGRRIVVGRARLTGDVLVVTGSEGDRTFERSEIVAILEGGTSELNRWSGKITAGVDAQTGNTEQTTLTASGEVAREGGFTRALMLARSTLGTSGGEQNVNKHRGEVKFDIFFTRHFYYTAIDTIFNHDEFQNLAFRTVPTTGLGWQIYDRSSFEWEVEAALGYQYTSYISVAPGQPISDQDAVSRLGSHLEWDIIKDLTFEARHDTILVMTNFGLSNYHTTLSLTYDITDLLEFGITVVHDRVRQPVPNSEGVVPQKDDMQLILSIGLEYR